MRAHTALRRALAFVLAWAVSAVSAPLPRTPAVTKFNEHPFAKRIFGKVIAGGHGLLDSIRGIVRGAVRGAETVLRVLTPVAALALLVVALSAWDASSAEIVLANTVAFSSISLRQAKASLITESRKILEEAEASEAKAEERGETVDTAEQRQQASNLLTQAEALDERIKLAEKQEQAEAGLGRSLGTKAGKQDSEGPASAERTGEGGGDTPHVTRYPERFTGQASRGIVIKRFLAGDKELAHRVVGMHRAMVIGDFAEVRALSEGTDSEGGYLVPDEFSADIIEKLGQETPFANNEFLRVIPMNRDTMRVPVLATRPDVQRIAENAAGTGGTDPAFGEVTLTANRFGRVLPMSEDLLSDEAIGLVEYLRDLYAEILAENRNNLIINGTGTNQPEGVRVNGDVPTTAAIMTDGGTIHDSVIDAYNAVSPKNRVGGIWVTGTQGWGILAKAKDADNRPLIQQLPGQAFATLLGRPLFVTEAVPENLGAGTNETELIFGNFRRGYVFGDRMQLAVKMNDGGKYFENFQAAIRVSERFDGKVGQADYFIRSTGWV